MRDINYPLQTAYNTALTGIVIDSIPVPVYYKKIPNNAPCDQYIIFSPITNNDVSPKTGFDTSSLMQLNVVTQGQNYNTGEMCGKIVDEIFTRIYTKPNTFQVTGFNVVSTKLDSDTTGELETRGLNTIVDRRLVFRHYITHGS